MKDLGSNECIQALIQEITLSTSSAYNGFIESSDREINASFQEQVSIEEVLRIRNLAFNALGSWDSVAEWLHTPRKQFGGQSPFHLLFSSKEGLILVERAIKDLGAS